MINVGDSLRVLLKQNLPLPTSKFITSNLRLRVLLKQNLPLQILTSGIVELGLRVLLKQNLPLLWQKHL